MRLTKIPVLRDLEYPRVHKAEYYLYVTFKTLLLFHPDLTQPRISAKFGFAEQSITIGGVVKLIRFVDNKHDNIKNKPFAEETFYLNPYEINELFVAREITLRYPGVRVSAK